MPALIAAIFFGNESDSVRFFRFYRLLRQPLQPVDLEEAAYTNDNPHPQRWNFLTYRTVLSITETGRAMPVVFGKG